MNTANPQPNAVGCGDDRNHTASVYATGAVCDAHLTLREHPCALITAAVTGQTDVREAA